MKLQFSRQIVEKCPNINFGENPPVGAELCQAVRRADVMKQIVAFRNFSNASKNSFRTSQ